MNVLNKISIVYMDNNKGFIEKDEILDEKLPKEIFIKIFSYLNDLEMRKTRLLSHYWNQEVIFNVKNNQIGKIQHLVRFLDEFFQENLCLYSLNNEIKRFRENFNFKTLEQVKEAIRDLHEMLSITSG